MLTTDQINEIHRLYWSEHWPVRKIERQLNIGWKTIRKYLDTPAQDATHRLRPSKLDPFKGAIAEWLEKDPRVTAAVIEQKLRSLGYQGGHSIIREHVRDVRPAPPKRAFVRMEPLAGERFEVVTTSSLYAPACQGISRGITETSGPVTSALSITPAIRANSMPSH
jgi:transposase